MIIPMANGCCSSAAKCGGSLCMFVLVCACLGSLNRFDFWQMDHHRAAEGHQSKSRSLSTWVTGITENYSAKVEILR